MRKLLTAAGGAALLSMTSVSNAGAVLDDIVSSGELRVCFEAGYMPFEMTTKKGTFIGFDIDMSKMMAKKMGVKFVPVNTAWDGIIPTLLTGKCHIINGGMTITAERNMRVNFANPNIVVGQTILINPALKDTIKSYRDLNNSKYTITTQIGTTGEKAARRLLGKAELNLFETKTDAALDVVNGKADAFIYDLPFNAVYSSQNKDKLVHLDTAFTYEPLAWAVPQGDAEILNFMNNFLAQAQGDGSYDRIYDKWFNNDSWLKQVQ